MNRVLIVDDNPDNRSLLRALLNEQGWEVDEARHGAEALEKARQSPPHIIISDLLMPAMDGYTLLRHWKADARLNQIPFVVYTDAYTGPQDEKVALDFGADAFILKSVDPEPFIARIGKILAKGHAGGLTPPHTTTGEEKALFKEYSEVLVRKLEEQTRSLEESNRALASREAHLRAIFETEPDCVKLLGADGSLLAMNAAGLRMLEADSFQQVENQCVYPLVAEEHRDAFRAFTERVFRGESGVLEFKIVGLKGGPRWMETHASPLRDPAGAVTAMLGITRDITSRKQGEAIISCRTEVLGKIAAGAPLAETLAMLLGHMEALAPEMLCSILVLDADGKHLRHGSAPSLPEAYMRAVDGGAIGANAASCGTAAFRREPVIVEDIATDPLWAGYRELALAHGLRACWSTPFLDEQQAVLGTFAIYYRQPCRPAPLHEQCIELATDLASIAISRERMQSALRASETRHRRLVESNIIGVTVADTDGRIFEANDCFLDMVGYTRADVESGTLRWDAMTPPEWRPVDDALCAALVRSGTGGPVEKEYLHKDGHRVPIVATVALLEGSLRTAICLIENITERKRAEEKIRAQLAELLRWQDVTLGREDRVMELKREVNELNRRLGEPIRYASQATS